ncbi:MAG: orotidine-5'-phosphate decarboxylase [Bacteroidaceae bacterium]|nr:orotidine-5'-phosphate decarboxylase [Bacteroidaceae bacterium]
MTREQLYENILRKQSFLCVGLDTDLKKVPQCLLERAAKEEGFDPIFEFNRAIIDATAPYCIAFKPNLAFYEAHGVKGWMAFEKTVKYIRERYPDQFIIADAKRGDIGNTSKLYARTFFEEMDVDAVTVAPYMGEDSVTPFLSTSPTSPEGEAKPSRNHWVILLALTSNKGSEDFQKFLIHSSQVTNPEVDDTLSGKPMRLFERVILRSQEWVEAAQSPDGKTVQSSDSLMYVVGATQGSAFADIRRLAPDHFLLVPGIGAQGGSLEEVCRYGWNDHCGLIVNSSRAIIYANSSERYAEVAAEKAHEVQWQMAAILRERV